MTTRPPAPRALLLVAHDRPSLGDCLQRLALIAPEDLHALGRLARDVLRHAEARYKRRFPHGPAPYDELTKSRR